MDHARNRHLSDALDTLTEALDGSGDDLTTILTVLIEDLTAAITSFVGLTVTVVVGDEPVTVMSMNSHTAASSLLLPLTPSIKVAAGSHLVLYAGNPGAFVDLAAAATTGGIREVVVLDRHLPPPSAFDVQRAVDEVADRSVIDKAIGFLIEQGHPPRHARNELHRRAAAAGISLTASAYGVLYADHEPDPQDEDQRAG